MKKERLPEFYFLCFFAYSVLGWCYEVFLYITRLVLASKA